MEFKEFLIVPEFIYKEQLRTEIKFGEFIKKEKTVDYMCKLKSATMCNDACTKMIVENRRYGYMIGRLFMPILKNNDK